MKFVWWKESNGGKGYGILLKKRDIVSQIKVLYSRGKIVNFFATISTRDLHTVVEKEDIVKICELGLLHRNDLF